MPFNRFSPSEERKQRELERLTNATHLHKESHKRSDVDNSPGAQHHTLGKGANQAASGLELKRALNRITDLETQLEDALTRLTQAEADINTLQASSHSH